MRELTNAVWIELRKASRSRMPLFTVLAFLVLAFGLAFLMFIYKYPTFARRIGLISAKANLAGGAATWPYYLSILGQAIAIGGLLLFSLLESWVFGREFADGTLKDLLAVPVARGNIILAKFLVVVLWSLLLKVIFILVSLLLGAAIGLSWGTTEVFLHRAIPGSRRLSGHRRCLSVRILRQCGTRLLATHGGRFTGVRAWQCACRRRVGKLFPLGGPRAICRVDRKRQSRSSELPACAPYGASRHGRYLPLLEMCRSEPLANIAERSSDVGA